MLYVQFWAPDDGWKNRLKHVECLTQINKLWNVASCWLYSANMEIITHTQTHIINFLTMLALHITPVAQNRWVLELQIYSPFSKDRIKIYHNGSHKTGGQTWYGSLMFHQCKQWHLLTNGWIIYVTDVIKCCMPATLHSQPLWSVTYFSIFQKNDTHSLPKRTEGDTSKCGYKDTRKLRDFTLRRKWLLKSVWS